jgi:aerobic carbon-monoxide dehydrogenase small subunit
MIHVSMTVNGIQESHAVEPRMLLVNYLRDRCGLTGANIGCDTTQCGCCTVQINGRATKSCTILAVQAQGVDVVTIEGLGRPGALHPMQAAFRKHHALQCGYCTPGMVMQGVDIIRRDRAGSEAEIRHELEGNICRCTGYQGIVDAIAEVAREAPESCKGPK